VRASPKHLQQLMLTDGDVFRKKINYRCGLCRTYKYIPVACKRPISFLSVYVTDDIQPILLAIMVVKKPFEKEK